MSLEQKTCTRCGTTVATDEVRCPVCGANPDIGALVVRRSYAPAVSWRRAAAPVAAGATMLAIGAGIKLVQLLLPKLRIRRVAPQPPAVVAQKRPDRGRIVAIRRRIWAVGDTGGPRRWGAEETIWQVPAED